GSYRRGQPYVGPKRPPGTAVPRGSASSGGASEAEPRGGGFPSMRQGTRNWTHARYKLPLPKRGPRTRVPRLWLLRLRPDQVHGSPSRGPLPGSGSSEVQLYAKGGDSSNTPRWQGFDSFF